MRSVRFNIPVKFRLFFPILIGIIVAIIAVTWFAISFFSKEITKVEQNNLIQETRTIISMLERESMLKRERTAANIRIAHDIFFNKKFTIADQTFSQKITNQITHSAHIARLKKWYLDDRELFDDSVYVDEARDLFGGTVSVFQKTDSGFVRIATNVMSSDTTRAVGTFIPNYSPVAVKILNGESYFGRAYVVNDWYITAYEPIYSNHVLVGMLYVGDKEKDLEYFRHMIKDIHLGRSGFVFVMDENKEIIVRPTDDLSYLHKQGVFDTIIAKKDGVLEVRDAKNRHMQYIAFRYFDEFKYYVIATISPYLESRHVIQNIIMSSVVTAILIIIIFSLVMYYFTTANVHRFLQDIEISNKKLMSAREALKDSENRFRSIFNSTSDDIFVMDTDLNFIEVNDRACETLGYSRQELLKMNMSDIKPEPLKHYIFQHRDKVLADGKYTYESEHVSKDRQIILVEMNCRQVEYNSKKYILSVSRNISERKKTEREILGAVIKAEENERERMSKDLHDGLGPLLSTIKLYVGELVSGGMDEKEKSEIEKYALELIDESIMSTRIISNNLMPRVMSDYGLVKAVETFCKRINLTSKLEIIFNSDLYLKQNQTVEVIIYRVINELVNNTIKHALAQNVYITLAIKENELVLDYFDNGIGFDFNQMLNDPKSGIGLKNIISRIKSVNGLIQVNVPVEKGFSVTIKIRTDL